MPSLVERPDMNSYDYDRGGPARMNGLATNGGFDHYRDDYGREDMRRDDDERYRRGIRNGGPSFDRFNTDYLDQNSLSDFRSNEPKFELDHLATFAAGTRNGVIHAEDGLRKLRQMENTTGIWTMRCMLIVERNYLVVLDNSTGEELERFPIQLVQDPTAVFKNDRREIYNNLILFTVIDDPKKRSPHADMHIFQSSKAPAQEIVDEILAAKSGQQRLYQGGGRKIPPPPSGPAPEPPNAYNFQGMREFIDSRQYQTNNIPSEVRQYQTNNIPSEVRQYNQFNQTSYSQGGQFGGPIGQQRSLITRINTVRERENIEGGSTEILERDVQLLNHCFDDIEKFVARLQQAAESYKELEKRKRDRGAKNKKKQSGDGMLNARARPPPDRDFVDIFQKFKLSFNLLAKLKAHIHDPNAPELVHFLFTPLSLIYEASRDPYHGNQNLGDQAVAPVLTGDAKQLLLNCLTSKEIELWQALGKHWTTSRDEWQGHIPPYIPEFYDGWQPAAAVFDELASRGAIMSQPAIMAAPLPMIEPIRSLPAIEDRQRGYNASRRPVSYPDEDRPLVDRYHRQDDFDRFEPNPRGYKSNPHAFEPLPSRGFEPVYIHSSTRGFETQTPRGFEPPRGYETHSNERSPPRSGMGSPYSSEFIEAPHVERNTRAQTPKSADRDNLPPGGYSRQEENSAFYDELRRLGNVTIYEAAHDRVGKNPKELTVQRGDILQVLDSTKNWWKLRNCKDQVGFAPYTILRAVKTEKEDHGERSEWTARTEKVNDRIPNGAPRTTNLEASQFVDDERASWRDRKAPRRRRHSRESSQRAEKPGDAYRGYTHHQQHEHQRRLDSPVRDYIEESDPRRTWSPPPVGRNFSAEPQRRVSAISNRQGSFLREHRNRSPTTQKFDTRAVDSEAPPLRPSFRGVTRPDVRTRRLSPPKFAPPPPPKAKMSTAEENLQEELHAKLSSRQRSFRTPNERVHKQAGEISKISQSSLAHDVMDWLINKGFSDMVKGTFVGYTGYDMFQLHLSDLEEMLGHEEAIRLDGLLTLQKSTSGYATRSAKELNDILRRRKENIEPEHEVLPYQQRQEEELRAGRGDYPRKSSAISLRDQLVRQKTRLRQSEDFDFY